MEREQVTIRIPKNLKAMIQRKADEEGQSFNTEIIILLQKALEVGSAHAQVHNGLRRR